MSKIYIFVASKTGSRVPCNYLGNQESPFFSLFHFALLICVMLMQRGPVAWNLTSVIKCFSILDLEKRRPARCILCSSRISISSVFDSVWCCEDYSLYSRYFKAHNLIGSGFLQA